MPELKSIKVNDFKGIDNQHFSPETINLITGRNNTGKTSLLEAIHLSTNPSSLTNYKKKIFSLINKSSNLCSIYLSFQEQNVQFKIEKPTEKERKNYLVEGIVQIIVSGFDFALPLDENSEKDNHSSLKKQLRNSIQNNIAPKVNLEKIDSDQMGSLKININGDVYPVLFIGEPSKDALGITTEDILNIIPDEIEEDKKRSLAVFIESAFPRNKVQFLEKPPEYKGIQFVERELTGQIDPKDGDQKAVRVAEIQDYLKQYDFVNNLKSFGLDYLVFEENDNHRYQVPYEFMGDGFQVIAHLLWELMAENIENSIVLIEEPENHMHPGYIQELVHFITKSAREQNIQYFITTHNQDFIKNFFDETLTPKSRTFLENEFSLIQMEKSGFSQLNYETAERDINELYLDLRGL